MVADTNLIPSAEALLKLSNASDVRNLDIIKEDKEQVMDKEKVMDEKRLGEGSKKVDVNKGKGKKRLREVVRGEESRGETDMKKGNKIQKITNNDINNSDPENNTNDYSSKRSKYLGFGSRGQPLVHTIYLPSEEVTSDGDTIYKPYTSILNMFVI